MRLLLLSAVVWIATVSGIPLDFNWDKFSAEGSLTNDLSSNTPEDDLPVADFAVGNPSDNLLSNNFPDDSNPDIFSQVREKSDVDTFRQLPDEPTVEPHVEPSVEPPVEPPVQPPAEPSGQSLDDSTLGLFGDSSDSDTSISVSKNPATLTPSCANFFGLACCMSGSGNSDSSMHDVSGCSGHDSSGGYCAGSLYCCFGFPAPTAFYNVKNVDAKQCYPISV